MINSGDTAWILVSTALVMMMTAPGLAFFYGGLVRRKNVLATMMQSFFVLCLISIQWILWGYSLSFGPDKGHFIGSLAWFGLKGVGMAPNPDYAATIPHLLFMVYQMMFAVITPALISGAFAERKRFASFVLFAALWSIFVYAPLAHWVWGVGGWMREMGALDFAGGTVVHISSGVAALVAALVLGRRIRSESERFEPHNVTLTILGAGLLWFGWFGFNGGSALGANGLAVNAVVVTTVAAAMACLTWVGASWLHKGHASVIGAASGAVAGLVAITPASGYVDTSAALAIGLVAGAICYSAILLRERLKVDDALDVWAVHGVGGTWGAIATGIFASTAVNAAGRDGLLRGNPNQVLIQLVAVGATWAFSAAATFVILKAIDVLLGLRVRREDEVMGLDLSQHGEVAYQQG